MHIHKCSASVCCVALQSSSCKIVCVVSHYLLEDDVKMCVRWIWNSFNIIASFTIICAENSLFRTLALMLFHWKILIHFPSDWTSHAVYYSCNLRSCREPSLPMYCLVINEDKKCIPFAATNHLEQPSFIWNSAVGRIRLQISAIKTCPKGNNLKFLISFKITAHFFWIRHFFSLQFCVQLDFSISRIPNQWREKKDYVRICVQLLWLLMWKNS